MQTKFSSFHPSQARLKPGIFLDRCQVNRRYLASLKSELLLQNFYQEAGLWQPAQKPAEAHWGWESPTSQVRGHFPGHYLSAAARQAVVYGDSELRGKVEWIVTELGRCQRENGGEWVFSIPEKYLDWARRGKSVWAPHYTIHKTLMGLYDTYELLGSQQALDILVRAADWFHRWTGQLSRQQIDDLLDFETGGMLEAWANLYGATGDPRHKELMERYDRPRLFERLLRGEDPLTNRHANTTIPEAHGAARAYEVTGEERWKEIALAYWRCAVDERGAFATGSQTAGEIWTAPFAFSARLSDKNQEHCVVYNMIRLADYLLRWTGDPVYADYIERNLYNGILAQQHPETGMIDYFLALRPGSRKRWGSPTDDFWCCHGSLVQAHPLNASLVYYAEGTGLTVSQYLPSELDWKRQEGSLKVQMELDREASTAQAHLPDGALERPLRWVVNLKVECLQPTSFGLKLRLPEWLAGQPALNLDGTPLPMTWEAGKPSFLNVEHTWTQNILRLELPMSLRSQPLPDRPESVAFLEGPVVLAGLCEEERALHGDPAHPERLLVPDGEREWGNWKIGYRAAGQETGLRFIPLYEVVDEAYSVYFPVS